MDISALFVGGSVTGAVFKKPITINGKTVDPSDPEVQKKLFSGTKVSASFYGPNARGGSLVNHGTITIDGTALEKADDAPVKPEPTQPEPTQTEPAQEHTEPERETVYIHDDIRVGDRHYSFDDTGKKSYVFTGTMTIGR